MLNSHNMLETFLPVIDIVLYMHNLDRKAILSFSELIALYNNLTNLHFKLRFTWLVGMMESSQAGPQAHHNGIFKQLGWLSLHNWCDFHKCSLLYKCRNNLAPQYLIDLFSSHNINHTHNIRHSNKLRCTKIRTQYYHYSTTMSGQRLWNDLLKVTCTYLIFPDVLLSSPHKGGGKQDAISCWYYSKANQNNNNQ